MFVCCCLSFNASSFLKLERNGSESRRNRRQWKQANPRKSSSVSGLQWLNDEVILCATKQNTLSLYFSMREVLRTKERPWKRPDDDQEGDPNFLFGDTSVFQSWDGFTIIPMNSFYYCGISFPFFLEVINGKRERDFPESRSRIWTLVTRLNERWKILRDSADASLFNERTDLHLQN
jgi:hypothetical protein